MSSCSSASLWYGNWHFSHINAALQTAESSVTDIKLMLQWNLLNMSCLDFFIYTSHSSILFIMSKEEKTQECTTAEMRKQQRHAIYTGNKTTKQQYIKNFTIKVHMIKQIHWPVNNERLECYFEKKNDKPACFVAFSPCVPAM